MSNPTFRPTKHRLIQTLRKMAAGWIENTDECIVGSNKGLRGTEDRTRILLEFGVKKGWLEIRAAGQFGERADHFHFTDFGMEEIRDTIAETTCAFSGKTITK